MTKTPHHNDLRGAPIAARLIAEVKEATSELKMAGWNAKLMSITIGDVTAVDLYVRNQRRRAAEAGIEFQEQHYPETITQIEIESALRALNADPRVTGIIIQRPLPKHISLKRLQATINPMKDVEGMHPATAGLVDLRGVGDRHLCLRRFPGSSGCHSAFCHRPANPPFNLLRDPHGRKHATSSGVTRYPEMMLQKFGVRNRELVSCTAHRSRERATGMLMALGFFAVRNAAVAKPITLHPFRGRCSKA